MKRILRNGLIIPLAFFTLGAIAMLYVYPRQSVDLPVKVENNSWNTKLADIFDDEPKDIFPAPVSADSGWIVPPDPYVIRQVHIQLDHIFKKSGVLNLDLINF